MAWFVYLIECVDGSVYTGIAIDVAKRYDISIDDGAGFSVGDTDAIDMRPVCRTGVGDQQGAEAVHL